MSWGISIFISIFNNTSLVLTNNHMLKSIFKNVSLFSANLKNWIRFIGYCLKRTMEKSMKFDKRI
jgi:hypothetical protein